MSRRSRPQIDSAGVAAECYYWRPPRAFSRTLQLEAYARARVRFDRPVLDLGCGDGTFGAALGRLGVLDRVDVGLDGSWRDLRLAAGRPRLGLVQGDLCRLPVRGGSVGSVIAHTVLSSLVSHDVRALDQSLSEIHRILRPGGALVLTVALPRFNQNLALARVLRRVGARRALAAYLDRVNRRHSHTWLLEPAIWREKLAQAGFLIEQSGHFFTRREARWYSLLHLARGFPLLKLLPAGRLHRGVAALEARLFRRILARERARSPAEGAEDAGFSFWIARKAGGTGWGDR